jgi:hypothetical protein
LRRESIETRKATLASVLRGCLPGLRLNEHLAHPGELVCAMGLEGIVSTLAPTETACSSNSREENNRNASTTGTSPRASVSDTRVWQFGAIA